MVVISIPLWLVTLGAILGASLLASVAIGALIHRNKTLAEWDQLLDDGYGRTIREMSGLGPTYYGAFDWQIHDPEVAA